MSLLKLLASRAKSATPRNEPSTPACPPSSEHTSSPAVSEIARVLALPRRPRPTDEALERLRVELEATLSLPNSLCECVSKYHRICCNHLLPVQTWALAEGRETQGILGPIGVGHGKTLLDLLMPMVVPCRVAVLLLPSKLKKQLLESDWHFYGQHWKLPNLAGSRWQHPGRPILHVVAFEELSGAKSTDLLEKLTPDLLICDEAHRLADSSAARTKRWLRYVRHNPSVKVFCWSGTLTKRSLKNWAHLSNASLKQGSPAPRDFPTLEAWAGATDPSEFQTPAGDLLKLCAPGETAFEGFGRRVVDTPGVISSGDAQACEASLIISQRPLTAPKVVVDALEKVAKLWERPDGETLIDPLSVARCMREVSCGFYYFWKWPRGEPKEVREKWLEARKEWRSEIRERLKRSAPHLDSPMLLARAAQRWHKGFVYLDEEGNRHTVPPYTHSTIEKHPTWESETWERWHELRDSAHPVTDALWLDDFMIEDVLAWLSEGPGLAWYEHDAMARRIMDRADGIVHCGPGDEGSSKLLKLRGTERVLLTIKSHGEGKNLQMFNRSLVANPPSGGAEWEQLLGRTHRTGQMQDEVLFDVYRHTQTFRDALDKARDLSGYIQGSFGNTQKLVAKATWRFSA